MAFSTKLVRSDTRLDLVNFNFHVLPLTNMSSKIENELDRLELRSMLED